MSEFFFLKIYKYNLRLPEPEERPFLPYNIHYQIEDDDELINNTNSTLSTSTIINNNTLPTISYNNINNNHSDEGLSNSSYGSSNISTSLNKIPINEKLTIPLLTIPTAPVVPPNFEDFEVISTCSTSASSSSCSPNFAQKFKKQQKIELNNLNNNKTNYNDDLFSTSLPSFNSQLSFKSEIIYEEIAKFSNWNELFHFLKKEIVS